jgi:hypothetical protein
MDGLLLTRRQRLRSFGERSVLVAGPSCVLALVVLGLGLWVDAVFVVAIAGLVALAVGSTLRTRRAAAIFGLLLAGGIYLFLLIGSWLLSHPIQRGD